MRKNPASQSGLFNPRVLVAFALCSVGVLLAMLSFAATPPSAMTSSAANLPGGSLFVDKHAGPLSGNARAAAGIPLAPAAAGSWAIVASPNTGSTQPNTLHAVTCVSASDCWAVGSYYIGGAYQTLIEHWAGSSWAIVTSPNTSSTQWNSLQAVTCVSASDCWAVGSYDNGTNGSGVYQTLIEHWDGSSWAIVTSPNTMSTEPNGLRGVTCVSASDCWAVGIYSDPTGSILLTLIERWDGTSWAIVTSPNALAAQLNFLFGVTCASASECWAVGYSDSFTGVFQTLIEQWNGSSWAIVTSPNAGGTQPSFLQAVTCVSASDCWAVGSYSNGGAYQTLIEQWGGTAWAIVTSPNTSSTQFNEPLAVTCVSASDCWAVGNYDIAGSASQTLIEQWDGSSWAIVTSPNTNSTQLNSLEAVTCVSASNCWAVGYYDINGSVNPSQTLIEHYTVPPVQLNAVVSRKTHGSAGTFDVDLPLTGTRGVECRSGGATSDYTLVFSFLNAMTNCGGASTGTVTSGPNSNQCTVNLTGVPNAQYLTVTLTGAVDSTGATGNVSGTMGVLVGDVNATGLVDGNDVSAVQGQARQTANSTNFRLDVNATGLIDGNDVSLVQGKTRTSLPSPP